MMIRMLQLRFHSKIALGFTLIFCIGHSIARAETVKYLDRGDKALAALYSSIRSAKKSIEMNYYSMSPYDSSTQVLMKAIADRKAELAKEGQNLEVRVIADAFHFTPETRAHFTRHLEEKGIKIKFFNTAEPPYPSANLRTHSKYTVVDGGEANAKLITGGRNLDDTYFGLGEEHNWIDRDIYIEGAPARTATENFNEIWKSKYTVASKPSSPEDYKKFADEFLEWKEDEENLETFLKSQSASIMNGTKAFQCKDVRFYADTTKHHEVSVKVANQSESPTKEDFRKFADERLRAKPAAEQVIKILKGATDLTIENYAYVATDDLQEIFKEKRDKSQKVRILTNHFEKSGEEIEKVHNS